MGSFGSFLLQEISLQPYPIEELSLKSNLPQRLIIEIILPFMKLGWVELVELNSKYNFRITSKGRSVANREELLMKESHWNLLGSFNRSITAKCYQ